MAAKLCIFDLDGTLLNTIDDIANSMNRVLKAHDYPEYSVEWYKYSVGQGSRKLLLDAVAEPDITDEKLEYLLRLYQEDYSLHCMELTKPYDGIPELLKRLGELSVRMAVISNKPEKILRQVISKYFGDVSFAAIYGELPGRPVKPDPHAAQEILSLTGFSTEETIFVGDSEVDMMFAERTSLFGIGVLWGFRNREVLVEHRAGALVERPEEILKWVCSYTNGG